MKQYKVGFICGFFDILHDGHIEILKRSKDLCDYLIVSVGTDQFMRERKHRESILKYEQRIKIVNAIKYVDKVVPEVDLDKMAAYNKYHFDVMFAGEDHLNEDIYIMYTKQLQDIGVDTIYFPRYNNISSTEIRRKIQLISGK